ncbi:MULTISPECIES: THUMP-like domain-containing protein [Microbacterium]|uniref:THUMP-like domain-containing protein n=1 Tax=Microbacterium TaxID=33882 RepID=UPI00046A83B2|nr:MULTISPECIES: SAM-dependent methyltransferase [Microbacterium]AMG83806.1 SAM-dependent methyltransferase [Microbacterium sp. PAMC 28756]QXE30686.1 SAM-dependent methyltransferase [Microbacterium paraoxydans]
MEMSELRALLTPAGLELLDALGPVTSTAEAAAAVSRLRAAGHSPDLVSAVVGQAHLRAKATAKFGPFAARMLFTRAGLEQATRLGVAARHAQRIRRAGLTSVADLGCGIGGDALAFAGAGLAVHAVDADEVTAALAAYNLAPFGDDATVRHATAEEALGEPVPGQAIWMDPARRTSGHSETRRVSADVYSPSLDWAFAVAAQRPTGIKLGPAHDRDALPADAETQWVSADGSVVELVVWSRELAREGVRRSALVIRGERSHELTGSADAEDAPVRALGAFLHEPDGAVIRARLIGDVARSLDAGMLDPRIAYLTSDAALTSPFVQSFRVRETLPITPKTINAALKTHGIGRIEIKKRGVDVDPAAFRRKLTLRGDAEATLILARFGDQRRAILADRVPAAD